MPKPLCFVLMPFGQKHGAGGGVVEFDAVYEEIIKPAIISASLVSIRADEEQTGGIIHKPMFERLILCDYAVADLTTANANVFYELGVRHAVKPATTVLIFAADGTRLPFDVALLRALPYRLGPDGKPSAAAEDSKKLAQLLMAARSDAVDSPVYQLVDNYPDIQHTKTDVFRDAEYSAAMKEKLRTARAAGLDAIKSVETELGPLHQVEAGVLVDLLLSYRAKSAWGEMIRVAEAMPQPLRQTPLVQEQFAFALNRLGRAADAEHVLRTLIESRGPSSETYGLLGRVYKDRWEAALKAGEKLLARGYLDKAIDAYMKGFEADWRDAYPGVNAATLMTLRNPDDPDLKRVLPVVRYAVERKIASGKPDYWDYATLLELAVLARDEKDALDSFTKALPLIRETWEPETTLRNLRLIHEAFAARNESPAWLADVEAELEKLKKNVKS